jgi:dUTP pyrophosphatase
MPQLLRIMPLASGSEYYKPQSAETTENFGYDLYVCQDVTLKLNETILVPMGLKAEPAETHGYFLMPRSSIFKTPLALRNSVGLIDSGYRSEIMAPLVNAYNSEEYTLKAGTRITQLALPTLKPFDVQIVSQLSDSVRGDKGLGSSGI